MNAIVTGSQKYGKPRLDSDVDLVILVSEDDLLTLKRLGKVTEPEKDSDSDPGTAGVDHGLTASIRFGDLNLICCTDPIAFAVWEKGTKQLCAERPVTRERAVQHFRDLRVNHGLKDAGRRWVIGDAVTYDWRGDARFGLITEIDYRSERCTVSYKGVDVSAVPFSKLKRSELKKGYVAGTNPTGSDTDGEEDV